MNFRLPRDTFFAATYFAAVVKICVTKDLRDFSTFGVFNVRRID
jgi:hypothetical protein